MQMYNKKNRKFDYFPLIDSQNVRKIQMKKEFKINEHY